jgi:hypothetical protein
MGSIFCRGKYEGKRPLERPRRKGKHVKMDLQEVGWGHALDLPGSGQTPVAAVVNTVMNFRVPQSVRNVVGVNNS